jgi:hypothetical protein
MFLLTALKVPKEHKKNRAMSLRLTVKGFGGDDHGKDNGKGRREVF